MLTKKRKSISTLFVNTDVKRSTLAILRERAKIAKMRRMDYGLSQQLSKDGAYHPLVKAILADQDQLPCQRELECLSSYWLNFACAAGSQNSVSYILVKILPNLERKEPFKPDSIGNTPLYYAASSGNEELCEHLMNEPYCCQVEPGITKFAELGGNPNIIKKFYEILFNEHSAPRFE